jgi:hypothetical protein
LYTEKNRSNLESWRPVVLENVKADSAQPINVGVIDAGEEAYPWRTHWVVVGQEKLQMEDTPCNYFSI